MAAGKNIWSRKKLREALPMMPDPFTVKELAKAAGVEARRTHGLLKGFDNVEKISIKRQNNIRCVWRVIDT